MAAFRYPYSIDTIRDIFEATLSGTPDDRERLVTLMADNERELEDYLTKQSFPSPYIVVAADGTGDYLSIKDAIDAQPTSPSVGELYPIFIKPGVYADSGTISLTDKYIVLFTHHDASFHNFDGNGSGQSVFWSMDGFTGTFGAIFMSGITFDTPPSVFRIGGGLNLTTLVMEKCDFNAPVGVIGGVGSVILFDTNLTANLSGASATNDYSLISAEGTPTYIWAEGSKFVLVDQTRTVTTLGHLRVHNCQIRIGGNLTATTSASHSTYPVVNFSDTYFITNGLYGSTLSFSNFGQVVFSACVDLGEGTYGGLGGISATTTSSSAGDGSRVVLTGNILPYCDVTLSGTLTHGYVTGVYARAIVSSTSFSTTVLDGIFNVIGINGNTAVTISGDNVIAKLAVMVNWTNEAASSNTALNVSGNNNIIDIVGLSKFTTGIVNTGTGNQINGRAPSGAAGGVLGGTYPNPTFAVDMATQAELDTHAALPGHTHPDLAAHDALGLATDAELTTHAGAADPHTVYQKESEKGSASGYASLDAGTKVPTAQLGSGTADATTFLRGDQTYASIAGASYGTPGVSRLGDATAAGSAGTSARSDHTHGRIDDMVLLTMGAL